MPSQWLCSLTPARNQCTTPPGARNAFLCVGVALSWCAPFLTKRLRYLYFRPRVFAIFLCYNVGLCPRRPGGSHRCFGLWRVRFPPCLVRPGRRLPVQGLSEGSLGFLDRLPAWRGPGTGEAPGLPEIKEKSGTGTAWHMESGPSRVNAPLGTGPGLCMFITIGPMKKL